MKCKEVIVTLLFSINILNVSMPFHGWIHCHTALLNQYLECLYAISWLNSLLSALLFWYNWVLCLTSKHLSSSYSCMILPRLSLVSRHWYLLLSAIHAFHYHYKLVTSLLLYRHPLFYSQIEEPKLNLPRREEITNNPSWLP